MTRGKFAVGLVQRVPEAADDLAEHLDDQDGELLIHLVMADILRLTLAAWGRGDHALTERILAFLDEALTEGDDRVQNAVSVSFVEDVGLWDEAMEPFVRSWPPALAMEAQRQRNGAGCSYMMSAERFA